MNRKRALEIANKMLAMKKASGDWLINNVSVFEAFDELQNIYEAKTLKIFKHQGIQGSCVIVSAKNFQEAEKFIRKKLDSNGFKNERLNIFEIEFATTQPTLIHLTNN
jgi:hypothetical protein